MPSRLVCPSIERTANAEATSIENVGVDHCSFDILVAEKLLHGADVVAILQQMSRKAVAQGMASDVLGDLGGVGSFFQSALNVAVIEMVAANFATAGIGAEAFGREDILPNPVARGVGRFARERQG